MFKGIGTLPGGSYHVQLKEDYKPVQHPPHQVAVSVKPAYKAELKRLVELGVIIEVQEFNNVINNNIMI